MGKHTKRKSGYLPKVAAGAAPVALLFAGPATALASQTDLTLPLDRIALPLDHQHNGTIDRELGTTSDGDASVLNGSLGATRHDTVGKQVGDAGFGSDVKEAVTGHHVSRDAEMIGSTLAQTTSTREGQAVSQAQKHKVALGNGVLAMTSNDQRLSRSGSRANALSLNPGEGTAGGLEQDERLLGGGEGGRYGMWLPQGIDVLSENTEQFDSGLRRSADLDGAVAGNGRFAGDLAGAFAARRSSGQAVDLGDVAAVGMSSDQHTDGQFRGALDASRAPAGTISHRLGDAMSGDFGQSHAIGGQAGPASGLLSTAQSGRLGQFANTDPSANGDSELADSISGDLGLDHVVRLHGGLTTSVRGTLPSQAGDSVTQEQTVSAGLLDEKPMQTTWTVSAPPLAFDPH
jgi:hypothetical protein